MWIIGFLHGFIILVLYLNSHGQISAIFSPFERIILPGIAIVTGIIGYYKLDDSKDMAKRGLIIGCFGLLFMLVILEYLMWMFYSFGGFGSY